MFARPSKAVEQAWDTRPGVEAGPDVNRPTPVKQPSRWSLRNWPVARKVFAIAAVPLTLAMVFGGLRIYDDVTNAGDQPSAIRDAVVVLVAIAFALVIVLLVARSLVRPLRTLRDSALQVAHHDLEHEIARVRAGDEREPEPLPVHTTEEVGQVAHAVDELHARALLLAGDEARLRLLVNDMFETMSRRNRSLVDQQLSLIDRLERNEEDPARLDSLFRLDHLAARMRRNGANLLVLAGAAASRDHGGPVPLATAIRAATSEVEDYRRVEVGTVPDCALIGSVAGDAIHLLAELIDNALRYSPPTVPVRVSAVHTSNWGVHLKVTDSGLGMTPADLRMANMRLRAGGEVTPDNARHMGLFVVGRLAERHGMAVRLRTSAEDQPDSGTTSELYVPPEVLVGATVEGHERHEGHVGPRQVAAHPQTPESAAPGEAAQSDRAYPTEIPVTLLARRNLGASGITDVPAAAAEPDRRARRELPQAWWEQTGEQPAVQSEVESPSEVSGYFSARSRAAGGEPEATPSPESTDSRAQLDTSDMDALAAEMAEPPTGAADDVIYQRMLSEWLVDPHTLVRPQEWKSVWDSGWSAAAEVDNVPVQSHTDHGLPVRDPGARLVPGSAPAEGSSEPNGNTHRNAVQSGRTPGHRADPERDPDAIRSSIDNHFGGVRAGRSHARETRQGGDHE
jgi:signal transduction histidine kinase